MAQADLNKLKQDLTRRMDGALDTLKREFDGLRTGRAHPGLLEPVKVQAYGIRDAADPGRHRRRAGAAHADRAGLGPQPGRCGGEGDPRFRPGPQSGRRRTAGPRADPAADHASGAPNWSRRRTNMPKAPRSRCARVRRDGMEQIKTHEKKHEIGEDVAKDWSTEVQKLTDQLHQARGRCAGGQGKGHPSGLIRRAMSRRCRPRGDGRCPAALPRMSRSSWTATAAGPPRVTCRGSPAIARAPGRSGAPSRRRSESGVAWLTIYAFSSENWRRPSGEVLDLTGLLRQYLQERDRRTESERRAAALHRRPGAVRCRHPAGSGRGGSGYAANAG